MMKWMVSKILETEMWRKFARHWMAGFTFRWFGWPKFPKSRYFAVKAAAKAMDGHCGILAFVSVDRFILNYKVNNFLTGAQWGHAGYVYWGPDGELRIKHMLNSGINDDYLLDLMGELDGFALLWIPLKDQDSLKECLRRIQCIDDAQQYIDYDYSLKLETDILAWVRDSSKVPLSSGKKRFRLYCSEYDYTIIHGLTKSADFVPHEFMERPVFEPDDLFHLSEVLFSERY